MAEPTERDRERARDWYTSNPRLVRGCPEHVALDLIRVYAQALADERARMLAMLDKMEQHGRAHVDNWDGRMKLSTIADALEADSG